MRHLLAVVLLGALFHSGRKTKHYLIRLIRMPCW